MTDVAERNLTEAERSAVCWLLQHANRAASSYTPHADRITVAGVCPCGCASVDFALDGNRPEPARMEIISDYYWADDHDHVGGIFLFAISGQLAGMEVYAMDDACDVCKLPELHRLRPIKSTKAGGQPRRI